MESMQEKGKEIPWMVLGALIASTSDVGEKNG